MSNNIKDTFASILSSIATAEQYLLAFGEDQVLSSSSWTLFEQLEHLAITGRSTPPLIMKAHEGKDECPINADGVRLFDLGAFPRGETDAPDFARPKGAKSSKILQSFKRMRKSFEDMEPLLDDMACSKGRSEHPRLGGLTALQWWTFVAMHLGHHLDIIAEGLAEHQRQS